MHSVSHLFSLSPKVPKSFKTCLCVIPDLDGYMTLKMEPPSHLQINHVMSLNKRMKLLRFHQLAPHLFRRTHGVE